MSTNTTQTDLAALAACPFCGKAAEFDPPAVYSGAPVFTVRCCIADTGMCFSKEAAIKKWNRRALAARPPGDGWVLIESAPRDGTSVLGWGVCAGYAPPKAWIMRIMPDETEGYWRRFDGARVRATHWRELPPAPAAGVGGESQ